MCLRCFAWSPEVEFGDGAYFEGTLDETENLIMKIVRHLPNHPLPDASEPPVNTATGFAPGEPTPGQEDYSEAFKSKEEQNNEEQVFLHHRNTDYVRLFRVFR